MNTHEDEASKVDLGAEIVTNEGIRAGVAKRNQLVQQSRVTAGALKSSGYYARSDVIGLPNLDMPISEKRRLPAAH